VDATFRLELNEYQGIVEPRLVLRHAEPCNPRPIALVGEPERYLDGVWRELDAPLELPRPPSSAGRVVRDRRGRGIAGTLGALVATGESVLVMCADAQRRLGHLEGRLGGFALASYQALEREPALSGTFTHVVALDPPVHAHLLALACAGETGQMTHLAWGEAELRFAQRVHQHEYGLRPSLAALYRALRGLEGAEGEELEAVLREDGQRPRSPALAGRLLRILRELSLVDLDHERRRVTVPAARRTDLERSAAFQAYERRHQDGQRYLSKVTARAA
jgi:single-stranded-DNA-specific exonuclease